MIRASLLVFLAASAGPAAAGPLSDFEKQATKPAAAAATAPAPSSPLLPQADTSGPPRRVSDDDDDGGFVGILFRPFFYAAFYGGASSQERVTGASGDAEPRSPGEPLIPYARGDFGYQYIRGGPSALDVRGEAGWAWAALETRLTNYRDRKTDETLSALSVNGLYRMSFGSRVEIDLGAGSFTLQGEGRHAGNTFTIPMRVAATDWLGLEARPSWHFIGENTIRDHSLFVRLGGRYAGFTAGYRWVESGSAKLDGPQVGLALSW